MVSCFRFGVSVFRWFRCFRFGVSVVSFRCFGGFVAFVSVFRWFRSGVSVVSAVSFRWFRFGVSGFSTCLVGDATEFYRVCGDHFVSGT